MSYFVLGCPACSAALQVSMYRKPKEPFNCVRCNASILLNQSLGLELSDVEPVDHMAQLKSDVADPLLELLIDAAGYGAFYYELSERDGGMSVAKSAEESVEKSAKVRQQMADWLKDYRQGRP